MATATTRSLLGWGVVAGPFYLVVGLVQALTRDGFDLTRHSLGALLLGDLGWVQLLNFVLAGLMTGAAAVGVARALEGPGRRLTGSLLGLYALCLVLAGFFPPDPVGGYPPGVAATVTVSGVLHLAFGGVGFLALGGAALVAARALPRPTWSRTAGLVVIVGFLGGAALSGGGAGIALLWAAVVAGWVWLAATSVALYRRAPHPVLARRA
jgi:hypothetical protein